MKILCLSDHVDPIVYSTQAKNHFSDINLVLGAGDIPMEYLGFVATMLNKPVVFVFGNHNLKHYSQIKGTNPYAFPQSGLRPMIPNTFGSIYIGDKINIVEGLIIMGLGGSRFYNGGENQYREWEMYLKIVKHIPRLLWNKLIYKRYLDILLTHAPPYGIGDQPDPCHTGFKALVWFLKKFRPKYHIHGHIHLYNRNAKRTRGLEETTIINAYDHCVIDFNQGVL